MLLFEQKEPVFPSERERLASFVHKLTFEMNISAVHSPLRCQSGDTS